MSENSGTKPDGVPAEVWAEYRELVADLLAANDESQVAYEAARAALDSFVAERLVQRKPDGWTVFLTSDDSGIHQAQWYRHRFDADFKLDEAKRMGFLSARIAPVYIGTAPQVAEPPRELRDNVFGMVQDAIEAVIKKRLRPTPAANRATDEIMDFVCGAQQAETQAER